MTWPSERGLKINSLREKVESVDDDVSKIQSYLFKKYVMFEEKEYNYIQLTQKLRVADSNPSINQ